MILNTHLSLENTLCGDVIALEKDYAKVSLQALPIMIADKKGLVHGGFIFGAADFCAMATVNDPYVVLAKSETKFLAPVKEGEVVLFEGKTIHKDGKKVKVEVMGSVEEKQVFWGVFYTVVLQKHVLS